MVTRRLIDVDITDRADGLVPTWDVASGTHQYGSAAGLPANKNWFTDNYSPDDYPASPNAVDDEFEGGGTLDAKWTATNNPAAGDVFNQTDFAGFLHVGLLELGTDDVANLVSLNQTAPVATAVATYRGKLALATQGIATDDGEFAGVGIGLIDTTNNQQVSAGIQLNNADTANSITTWAGMSTANTIGNMTTIEGGLKFSPGAWVYAELRKTTTAAYTSANTYEAWISLNGIIWYQIGTCSFTFTGTPVVGITLRRPKSQTGTPKAEAIVDFFRKVA